MLVRFYSIEWSDVNEDLPSSAILELDDDIDENEIEMMGADMLQEEFGVEVDTYEWEFVSGGDEDATDDPFSFGRDEDED